MYQFEFKYLLYLAIIFTKYKNEISQFFFRGAVYIYVQLLDIFLRVTKTFKNGSMPMLTIVTLVTHYGQVIPCGDMETILKDDSVINHYDYLDIKLFTFPFKPPGAYESNLTYR